MDTFFVVYIFTKTRTMSLNQTKLIECPRDAMQGIHPFIDTDLKAAYINLLLEVGFDTLDFGSFVSPKAVPQMKDTAEVLAKLNLNHTATRLLAIVANLRGVQDALIHPEIDYLGFPFSISETFQQRNTNSSIEQSLATLDAFLNLCSQKGKTAVVYLSMAFGNPYGDEWNNDIVYHYSQALISRGVQILALSDTVGVSTPGQIRSMVPPLIHDFPEVEIGLHLHSLPESRLEKITAAYESGCRRFDSAIKGFGGCPMAKDDLTGNLATEDLLHYLKQRDALPALNEDKWLAALKFSDQVFNSVSL